MSTDMKRLLLWGLFMPVLWLGYGPVMWLLFSVCSDCAAKHWAIKTRLTELEAALERERAARRGVEAELESEREARRAAEYALQDERNRPRWGRWGPVEDGAVDAMIRAVRRCLWLPSLREKFGEAFHATLTTLEKQKRTPLRGDGNVISYYRSKILLSPRTLRRSAEDLERAVDEFGTGAERDALVELIRSTRTYARIVEYIEIK